MRLLVTSKTALFKRLFSSLAWRLFWPSSSPVAAQPSSPAATPHAAAAGIAEPFRFSVCSWLIYVKQSFVKNPAETHPQNSSPQSSVCDAQCHFSAKRFWRWVCQSTKKVPRWVGLMGILHAPTYFVSKANPAKKIRIWFVYACLVLATAVWFSVWSYKIV
jgi:hypothetical protein